MAPGKELTASQTAGLTPARQDLVKKLASLGQYHLFEKLFPGTSDDEIRKKLVEQLESLDLEYADGGLEGYITNARKLLENSRKGVNPLEGWVPSVPQGQMFELGTNEYKDTAGVGVRELGSVGFVLVAGGLGERLGYSSIKVGLPTEMTTETCYLEYYIQYILALQTKYAPGGRKLPLCIMTSGDTNARTVALLEKNKYFGMGKSQITIVQQGQGVPALMDNNAKMVLDPDDPSRVLTKPHGHGDIHALLYNHNVAKKWFDAGIKWLVLFQDTNGLAFHTLPLMLGVSKNLNLIMNSLAVPRKAKQAIGAITQLTNSKTGEYRTINVEYNQLDPLLRANGFKDGDVNDSKTGFSPYPGNINQLLFQLDGYNTALQRTKGLMPEFVNPKYADAAKTVFKKPTRLECMMQDFPTVLEGDDAKRVGFTSIEAGMCFSPVKNATADGVGIQAKGTHPGVAATGEADQYAAFRKILKSEGCKIKDAAERTFAGIKVVPGPAIVLKPDFACCPGEYRAKFPTPQQVEISERSTLVVRGSNVVIESLKLDGCLIVDGGEATTTRRRTALVVLTLLAIGIAVFAQSLVTAETADILGDIQSKPELVVQVALVTTCYAFALFIIVTAASDAFLGGSAPGPLRQTVEFLDRLINAELRIRNLEVKNDGYEFVPDENSADEVIKMRGYRIKKKGAKEISN